MYFSFFWFALLEIIIKTGKIGVVVTGVATSLTGVRANGLFSLLFSKRKKVNVATPDPMKRVLRP